MSRHHSMRGNPPIPYFLIGAIFTFVFLLAVVAPVMIAVREGRPFWFVVLMPFAAPIVFALFHLVGFVVSWVAEKWIKP